MSETIELLCGMLEFAYMRRAFAVGLPVSLCAALLGVNLVLKRYSMIGDGLSHVGFGAMSVALALGIAPLPFAVPVVMAAAFLLLRLSESGRIRGDAAIALVASGSLAVGLIVVSRSTGMNADVSGYMFGSILAMSAADARLSIGLCAAVLGVYVFFYNRLFAVTFDEGFAAATGVKTRLFNMLVAMLTAVTVVVGMRMTGALLISSLIIFPLLTAMRVFRSFRAVTVASGTLAVVCFTLGLCASYLYATPVGASVVAANLAAFFLFWAVGIIKRK